MLESGPRIARERFLRRGRSRLYVRELGEGRPVVVLHGGPDFEHESLLPQLELPAADARLVYYDQRGRGRSFSGERPPDVTIASEIEDLDAVRASVGAARVAVLGHSFGTLLALEYAIRHADRVSHLVLLNPAPVSRAAMRTFRDHLAALRTPEERSRMRELAADPAYMRGELAADAEFHRIHFRPTARRRELDVLVGRLRRAFTPAGVVAAREIETSLYADTFDRDAY